MFSVIKWKVSMHKSLLILYFVFMQTVIFSNKSANISLLLWNFGEQKKINTSFFMKENIFI